MGATRPADDGAEATTFGDVLRRSRVVAGLTQEALAERSGLSARGISDLERGVRAVPRKDTLALLLDALQPTPRPGRRCWPPPVERRPLLLPALAPPRRCPSRSPPWWGGRWRPCGNCCDVLRSAS
ncbi:MAG: helix-turn-helix domain-containing protein [Chloroflexota bacterium]|nr:helix-turn-helix domain-containing protein [Chloroflexota bacterium]